MRILLVGENPNGISGNSSFFRSTLKQIKDSPHEIVAFSATEFPYARDLYSEDVFKGITVIQGTPKPDDEFCGRDLLNILAGQKLDLLIFVGLDCWRYINFFDHLKNIQKNKKFKIMALFPYDVNGVRRDWLRWIKAFDYPIVYSKYGYDVLKAHVPNLRYFRPKLDDEKKFVCFSPEDKKECKRQMFPETPEDAFVFGFIGNNQFRKDPQRLIHTFFKVKRSKRIERPIVLYLHMELESGVYNVIQYIAENGGTMGDVVAKKQNTVYTKDIMVQVYNSIDCLVSTSLQEGLSWTVIEAGLCGTPVLLSNTTSHKEIGNLGLIPCTDLAFVPVITERKQSFIESRACNVDALVDKMILVVNNNDFREKLKVDGQSIAMEWCLGSEEFLTLIDSVELYKEKPKEKAILFVQHSSAGDVLMTTQCFKGIKEKHPNLPLVYMTQDHYTDIVENNPYIDKIIKWDEDSLGGYTIVYNPHGEKILPGGWNNGDVRLHDMYPYFCNVKADDMFIDLVKPKVELPEEYIVVQTSGGQKEYRTFNHMDIVVKKLGIPAVLIGAYDDKNVESALDLRGILSWREVAWVIKHAKLSIVIDSFPSHLAGALHAPAIVLFGPAPARVVGPKSDPDITVFLEPDKMKVCPISANCWGDKSKVRCVSPCINSISPFAVVKAAQKLLGVTL